jgi:hypothetical protein
VAADAKAVAEAIATDMKADAAVVDVKPVQGELALPTLEKKRRLEVVLDESEYQLILTYTKLFNAEHEGAEGFTRVEEGQYLLLATLRWIDYSERAAAEGMEMGEAEDVTPAEPTPAATSAVSVPDPVEDDPEFIAALEARVGGERP